MPPSSPLDELQVWYVKHCDGEWEHHFGVGISNIDNPGWVFSVDLTGTELEQVPFEEIKENYEDDLEWVICGKQDGKFLGNGGPMKLGRMIEIFLSWANSASQT